MSFDYQDKKTCSTKNNALNITNNIKEFELIKNYLNSQPDKINNLINVSKTLNSTIINFIEYTKNYSSQIEFLAMKMIPNYSIEGQLIQAIQAFLLFFSEGINNLVSQLRKNMSTKQDEDLSQVIEQFNVQKKLYYHKIKNVNSSYKNFKKEINLYQEYLVNIEYKEHEKKGILINCDDTICIDDTKGKNEIKKLPNDNSDEEDNYLGCYLNDTDNKSSLIKSNKDYVKHINESNDLLNKIKQFLSIEKTNILKGIYNICHHFGEGLVKYVVNSQTNFKNQTEVVDGLLNKLILDEKDTTILTDTTIKLKYLEIYNKHILEKTDLKQKNSDSKEVDNNDKIKEKKIDKNNKQNQKGRKKSISIAEEAYKGPKNDFIERKTVALSNKQLNNDYFRATSFNLNQFSDLVEEEKEELFKKIVEKLNRDEIINIFEKIKETNITINELDNKLIEYEKNYKKIKEQLVTIFNYPEKYSENDKNSLINFFEQDENYILYFIKILNDHRAKGNFFLSELTFKYLGEIFKYLNNLILKKHNIELFKFILILSQTYYNSTENDKKKTYLFSFIRDFPDYSNPGFWEDYLKELINHDLEKAGKNDIDLDNLKLDNMNKGEKENLVNCFFSNLLTTTKALADFNLDEQFVKDFVEKNKSKFFLTQEQVNNILLIFEMSYQENEINKKENQNKTDIAFDKCDKKEDKEKIKKDEVAKEENQIINENINIINDKNEINSKKTESKDIEQKFNENKLIDKDNDINNIVDKNKIIEEENQKPKEIESENKESEIIIEKKLEPPKENINTERKENIEYENKNEAKENDAKKDSEIKEENKDEEIKIEIKKENGDNIESNDTQIKKNT